MKRSEWMPPVIAAAGFLVIGGLEIVLDPGFRSAPGAPMLVLALVVVGTLVAAVAPITGSTIVAALFPVATALGLDGPTGVGVLAYFLLPGWAGYRRDVRRSWIAPLAAQVMATLGVAIGAAVEAAARAATAVGPNAATIVPPDLGAAVWENLFFSSLAWASWAVGVVARSARNRAVRAERLAAALDAEREAREQAVLAEERQRIARDLHDSVAHSVSVMTLQVGAVRSTLPADAPQLDMLLGIERLGRESVAELRSAVGILRRTADDGATSRPPSLDRAEELLDEVRAAGLDVVMRSEGEPVPLARTVDVSAYRVLQESLTNVLRHAPGATAEVRIGWSPSGVEVEVRNGPARAASGLDPSAAGHGLVGMRERVSLVGGAFEAGPTPDGGWRVLAVLPSGGGA
ncbi:sensor histidine kinase [Microbacterium sp. ASV49]|uniref:histidine kinase n=1 Tax=Microbacterium candidum TaxID=3041922 RepID=A0ABT7MX87_9MICO|nr:sensor histidine kinase [Microbacterium sp. ASV49]MDL9979063.1 sensor histidine kinase [Microbacterium sp. ASV49]